MKKIQNHEGSCIYSQAFEDKHVITRKCRKKPQNLTLVQSDRRGGVLGEMKKYRSFAQDTQRIALLFILYLPSSDSTR